MQDYIPILANLIQLSTIEKSLRVAMAPVEFINQTLLREGSSFRGTMESSRKLLGTIASYQGNWLSGNLAVPDEVVASVVSWYD